MAAWMVVTTVVPTAGKKAVQMVVSTAGRTVAVTAV